MGDAGTVENDAVLAFVERVEGRLEAASTEAPGFYDDVIDILRDEAHARPIPPADGGTDD
jgi:hypothetical protein